MKIKRINNETKQLFETIPIGSCFIEGEDRIYMKTVPINSINSSYQAVCLETGQLYGFSPKTPVKPIQAELIVKE